MKSHDSLSTSFSRFFFSFQVVLKIIKHYQEEGQGSEVVQGVLLGLVVDDRLEITNCFPFPQHTEDDADFDEGKHESATLFLIVSWNKLISRSGQQFKFKPASLILPFWG